MPTRKKISRTANAEIKALLDEILAILKRDGKTVSDLAKDLDRSYLQTYDWVVLRKFNPRADALLALAAWRDRNKHPARNVPSKADKSNGTQ